jgi:hypothetical protein
MKKIIACLCFVLFLSTQTTSASVADNTIIISAPTNVGASTATFVGKTGARTATGETVQVYFEYGLSSSSFTSSSSPRDLSSGTTVSGDLKEFSVPVSNLPENKQMYVRVVRKVTSASNVVNHYRSTYFSFNTLVNNLPPYIRSLTKNNSNFTTSACNQTACTIEIPENLPDRIIIANLVKADPNEDSVTLTIDSGNTNNAFAITSFGDLSVNSKSALDFERNPVFNLVLKLRDSGPGRLTSTYALTIRLKDIANESLPLPTIYTSSSTVSTASYIYTPPSNVNYSSSGQRNVPSYEYDLPSQGSINYSSRSSVSSDSYEYTTNRDANYGSRSNLDTDSYSLGSQNSVNYSSRGNANTNSYSSNNPGSVNYVSNPNNNTGNPYSNLSAPQRQLAINNILAQLAILQAELDRRIRLGIQ